MTKTILIVEDEEKIAALMRDYLRQYDFDTFEIDHGNEVLTWLKRHQPDLILLDIMLPGQDGISICREIRKTSDVPVIFMTARVEEIDRLLGLEMGADDYICKPFSPREVVARVKAVLRRTDSRQSSMSDDPLHLNESSMKATVHGVDIELTAVEFRLLNTLVARPGVIYSRQQLMDSIYSDQRIVSDRTIDSHVKKIRKKLDLNDHIHSVYGVGYKYECPLPE
ncbi:MAG: response regulator [Gammaproteobacteria bacterium]|nr:response regulator [Gammaproteobacteria bacterium]